MGTTLFTPLSLHGRFIPILLALGLILGACSDGSDSEENSDGSDSEENAVAAPEDDSSDDESADSDTAATEPVDDQCGPDQGHQLTMTSSSVGFLYFPFYVADEAGFLADNGVEVERFNAAGGNVPALMGGDSDIIETAITAVFNLRNEDQDVVAIGTYINEYAANVVVTQEFIDRTGVSADSSFEDKALALEGARIGTTSPGAGADLLPRAILSEVGLDPDSDAEIIYLESGGAMLAAFEQGRIDAFVLSSPTATTAVMELGGTILINPTLGDYDRVSDYAYVGLVTKNKWLEDDDNRSAAGCFLKSIDQALELIVNDPDEALEVARPYFGDIDEALYRQAYEETVAGYKSTVCVDPESIKNAIEFDQMFRSVDNPPPDHYDNTLCEEYTDGG